jgi:hypothetical protein
MFSIVLLSSDFIIKEADDLLCDLSVRFPGYRSRGPGLDSQHCRIFLLVVGLEWGPLSLVRIIKQILE